MIVFTTVAERFDLLERIGAGGMGVVYRARDGVTGATVAVKTQRVSAGDAAAREAEHLEKLYHPGVVRFVAAGIDDGVRFLAMEYLEGETLAARLAREGLTLAEALEVGQALATALEHAHERGVVHFDLKPSNLFLVDGQLGAVKLIDFGVAHGVGTKPAKSPTGTPGYMAPEQAAGCPAAPTADVYGLGCVLFKCLTGKNAHRGTDPVAIMAKILNEPPPRPRFYDEAIPTALDDLVARMLTKDPTARPASMAVVRAALAAITG